MKPIIIHTEAITEFDSAIAYYEDQKIGLGLYLLSEVEEVLGENTTKSPFGSATHNCRGTSLRHPTVSISHFLRRIRGVYLGNCYSAREAKTKLLEK